MAPCDEATQPKSSNEDTNTGEERRETTQGQDMLCGIGAFRPACLQQLNRMGVFTGVYSVSGLLTSVLSMYIVSQVTAIEKQFGLSSSQSGFLLSCNDIGFLLTTMFASYAARRVHIPRVLWASTLLYGVGGLVCSLAYFISKDIFEARVEELGQGADNLSKIIALQSAIETPLCSAESTPNTTECMKKEESFVLGLPNKYSAIGMGLLVFGMLIQGVSKSCRFPFMVTYVDDYGKKKNTAMNTSIVMGVGFLSPAFAFGLGGLFSRIYVTLEDVPMSPRHPLWIGAWWLGFIVFAVLAIIFATPLLFFPRRMKAPVTPEKRQEPTTRVHPRRKLLNYASGVVKAMLRLVTNRVYILLILSNTFTMFSVAGLVAFGPKYFEAQYFLPAWKSNIVVGSVSIVSVGLGTVIGGCVITKRLLTPQQCLKLMLGFQIVTIALFCLGFVLGCSNADIVGINDDRGVSESGASCSVECRCESTWYYPVCGSDDRNYFSPCVAGCRNQPSRLFAECGCVGHNTTAVPGLCQTQCSMLVPYMLVYMVANLFSAMTVIPTIIVSIRCISEEDKSMAAGFLSLMQTVFGWFLAPIVFGRVIDTTCQIWTTSCESRGACALYDNDKLRLAKVAFDTAPRAVALVLLILTFLAARTKTDWNSDEKGGATDGSVVAGVGQIQLESPKPLVNSGSAAV